MGTPATTLIRKDERLVPIAAAANRLGRSVWTLKRRLFPAGLLPVLISQGMWFVYESFIDDVLAPPRPGEMRTIEQVAADWFARNSAPVAAEVA